MTPLDRALIEAFVASFPYHAPILEIGARQLRPGGDPSTDLRALFAENRFIGTDFQSGAGVDCVMNASQLAVRTGVIGTVLMVSSLEHIWDIQGTIASIRRVLGDNGVVILTSHMDKSIHAYPSDYWRFTPQAFAELLSPFSARLVGFQGRANQPINLFGIGLRQPPHDLLARSEDFRARLEHALFRVKQDLPLRRKIQRRRRLIFWRIFGSKAAYQAARDEYTIGWHTFPADETPDR